MIIFFKIYALKIVIHIYVFQLVSSYGESVFIVSFYILKLDNSLNNILIKFSFLFLFTLFIILFKLYFVINVIIWF